MANFYRGGVECAEVAQFSGQDDSGGALQDIRQSRRPLCRGCGDACRYFLNYFLEKDVKRYGKDRSLQMQTEA
jgi:hypothetical protein